MSLVDKYIDVFLLAATTLVCKSPYKLPLLVGKPAQFDTLKLESIKKSTLQFFKIFPDSFSAPRGEQHAFYQRNIVLIAARNVI